MEYFKDTSTVLKEASRLASKFRGFSQREDLIQEGVLAYYEGVAKGVTDEWRLVTDMRKAMYTYANYNSKSVKVPNSGNSYKLTKDLPPEEYDKLSEKERAVYQILRQTESSLDGLECELIVSGLPIETSLAVREAFSKLTKVEKEVLFCTILNDMSTVETGVILDMRQQKVSSIKKNALAKLSRLL